jgi:choline transport protein
MENYSAELGSVLTQDELQLRANGHKGELPRRFSRLAALSFAFGITNSWIGISATFTIPLACGGGPAVFYSLLVAGVACFIIS